MEQDFFKLGVQAANTGDYQKAQAYFSQFVQANPNSEKGWLYLGHCLADAEKRVTCYQRVLRINPSNEEAQRALSALSQPNRPREINQDLYERQPAPVRSTEKARQMPPSQTAKPHKRSVNIVTILIGFVVGLIVCVGIVCVAISQMSPKTQALPTLTPIPTPSLPELNTAVLPPAVAPAGAGKACLGFWERGIACLDERGWQIYNNENMGFSSEYITTGTICPDGRLAVAHTYGFARGYDQQWEQIPEIGEGRSGVRGLACDRDNRLWVAHYKGVSRYADGAWQTYGLDLLAMGEMVKEYVTTIVAAPDGKIWALTPKGVALFTDEKWTIFQDGQGFLGIPSALALDATGRPWVWVGDGVAVYENESWKQFKTTAPTFPELISLDSRGWYWMGTFDKGVAVFDGATWSSYNRDTQNLSNNRITALATDSLGRVWAGTWHGLSIFDGSQWQTYRMDNADLLDNRITFVAVERDGPTLPPPVEKQKGSLTGTLPIPGKRVELCSEAIDNPSGNTPCAGQSFSMSTQSNNQGVFIFENIPPGYYYLLAETGNGWAELFDQLGVFSEMVLIKPGELYDLGTLEFITN